MNFTIIKHHTHISSVLHAWDTEHLIVENGEENIFFGIENKLVVTDAFFENMPNVFSSCTKLKSIDFTNFDFSKITTMESWFFGCNHLKTVIFPENMDCTNLINLNRTFQATSLKNIDLSHWQFDTTVPVSMEYTFAFCDHLEKIILPNVIFDNIGGLALDCFKLNSVSFAGGEFTEDGINQSVDSFGNCENIELIDMYKFKTRYLDGLKEFFTSSLMETLDGANKKVVIILPDE